MARSTRRRDAARRADNPRRVAVELLGMLLLAAALLAAPFVYLAVRVEKAQRPSAALVAAIEHSDCAQLRDQIDALRANAGSDASFDLLSPRAETERRIVSRSEDLRCRPAITPPPAYD